MKKEIIREKIQETAEEIEEMNVDQMFDYFKDPSKWRERMAFLLLRRNILEEIEKLTLRSV